MCFHLRWRFWNRHEKLNLTSSIFPLFIFLPIHCKSASFWYSEDGEMGGWSSGERQSSSAALCSSGDSIKKQGGRERAENGETFNWVFNSSLTYPHRETFSYSKNLTSPDSAHTAANVTASNIHISLSAKRMEDLDEREQEKERNFQRAALKSLSGTTSELIERPCVSGNSSERAQKNFVEQLLLTGEQHYNTPPSWCTMGYEEKTPDRRWTQKDLKYNAASNNYLAWTYQSLLLQQSQRKAT